MNEETINLEDIQANRRYHPRHQANTQVFVRNGKVRTPCRTVNLSVNGVALRTEQPLGLRPGTIVELSFVINLGQISKIHRRQARVTHISNGVTGFSMDKYEGK